SVTLSGKYLPRTNPLRRARQRVPAVGPGVGTRHPRSWTSGSRRGRSRGGEIAALLGIQPLASYAGVAGARKQLGFLREGHPVSARHRPAEGILPDPGARYAAGDSGARGGGAPVG